MCWWGRRCRWKVLSNCKQSSSPSHHTNKQLQTETTTVYHRYTPHTTHHTGDGRSLFVLFLTAGLHCSLDINKCGLDRSEEMLRQKLCQNYSPGPGQYLIEYKHYFGTREAGVGVWGPNFRYWDGNISFPRVELYHSKQETDTSFVLPDQRR